MSRESAPRPTLAGRCILLTRFARPGQTLGDRLRDLGARVESRPTVQLDPPQDPRNCEAVVANLDSYDWLLFTSANAVRFFFSIFRTVDPTGPACAAQVGAIGKATAEALVEQGMPPDLVARESDSEGFASLLGKRISRGQRVLLVRPERARRLLPDALRAMGADLDSVAFYRNVPPADIDVIARDVCADRYDVVVFHSPSALRHLLAAEPAGDSVERALRRLSVVAIGSVTGGALDEAGIAPAAIAAEASDDGVFDAVCAL